MGETELKSAGRASSRRAKGQGPVPPERIRGPLWGFPESYAAASCPYLRKGQAVFCSKPCSPKRRLGGSTARGWWGAVAAGGNPRTRRRPLPDAQSTTVPIPALFPSRTLLGHHCNSGQNCKAIMHPGIYLLIIPRKPVFFSVTRMLIQSNFKDNWCVWGGVDHRSLSSSHHSKELIEDGRKEN